MPERERCCKRNVVYVAETKAWLEDSQILRSLNEHFETVVTWTSGRRKHTNALFSPKRQVATSELRNLARLVSTPGFFRGRWLFVCMAGHYSFLALALLLKLLGRKPRIFLFNFYLHGLGTNRIVKRILRILLGKHVRILCQTREELPYFEEIRPDVILDFAPFGQGPLLEPDWIGDDGYVFTGGFTNRDYDLLLRCAERLPGTSFVIACSALNLLDVRVPVNVSVVRDVEWAAFHRLLGHSGVVVVPLRERVGASGQMVALAAMEAGKAMIVPDVDSVSQYVDDGVTGFVYRLGDEDSLVGELEHCLHPGTAARVGRAARDSYFARFVRERFEEAVVRGVLEHARD